MEEITPQTTSHQIIEPSVEQPQDVQVINGDKADDIVKGITNAMSYDKSEYLTAKDIKNLKRNRYDLIATKFNEGYVLRNFKTKQVVEIRAASGYHAIGLIGWRPRHSEVIDIVQY